MGGVLFLFYERYAADRTIRRSCKVGESLVAQNNEDSELLVENMTDLDNVR